MERRFRLGSLYYRDARQLIQKLPDGCVNPILVLSVSFILYGLLSYLGGLKDPLIREASFRLTGIGYRDASFSRSG